MKLKHVKNFIEYIKEKLNISGVTSNKINEGMPSYEDKLTYVWCIKTKDYERIPFYLSYSKVNPLETIPEFDQDDYWEIDFQSNKYKTSPNDNSFVLIPKSDVISVWVEDNLLPPKTIGMSTGYPITKQSCTIHGVMSSYSQEVEKEAYTMIQKYGKKRAEEEAILTAESYIEDIKNLKYYNAEKIDLWDKRKFFWFEVSKCIRNWV